MVHYTAKRYLESASQQLFPGFHAVITMSCATYLTLDALREATLHEIVSSFPLACYAAQYIGNHAREHPEDSLESSILSVICDLLSTPRKRKPLLSLLNSLDLIRTGVYSTTNQALQLEDDVLGPDASLALDESAGTDGAVAELTQDLSALSSTDDLTSEVSMSSSTAAANQLKLDATQSRFPEVTALHLAASMGLAKVASMLLRNASDIDAVDGTGKTALAIAMERGMQSAVSLLIENGASVALDSAQGQRVFLLTAEREWSGVADSIIRKATESGASSEVRLLIAAYQGDVAEIQKLSSGMLELVLKTTAQDFGATALLLAVERSHNEVIAPLLAAGVDVNTPDGSGQTVLHRAARRKDIDMLRTLITAGASVDEKNDDGWTPLTATTRLQDLELARFLTNAGCSPNTTAHNGLSELYEAATAGETEYVKFLLAIGTDPSIRTRPGWAPLHWSAANGHVETTRLLLEAGAEVSVVSDQNVTPLDLALQARQTTIVNMLLKAGAKQGEEVLRMSDQGGSLTHLHEYSMNPIADDNKLVLMFDEPALTASMGYGQFVYQPEQGGRVYFISQLLDNTSTDTLTVRLASAPGMPREYAGVSDGQWPSDRISFADRLFEITKVRADHVEYSIRGGSANPEPSSTTLVKSWTGDWKAHQVIGGSDRVIFQTVPDWAAEGAKVAAGERTRFVGEHGELLARMNWLSQVPVARIEGGLALGMQHLLVACWVGMLWAETVGRKGAAGAVR